jgi:hypothetical protein
MKISTHTILILLAMGIYSCKKQSGEEPTNNTNQLNGTYTGHLIADYKASNNWDTGPITSNVTLSFTNGDYGSATAPVTKYVGGYRGTADSGKYVLQNKQLTFIDSALYPEMFDHYLILDGSYNVIIKADSLVLFKTVYGNNYVYKLKKD